MPKLDSSEIATCSQQPAIRKSEEYFRMYPRAIAELPYEKIDQVISQLIDACEHGKNVFLFGNGGSAALASHFACDLGKGTLFDRARQKRFRAMALTDNIPLMTAWANDSSYKDIFAEQLSNFVAQGDVAFAISGSGNSPNVLRGLEVARHHGACTIGLTGFEGGKMKNLCDICMIIPSNNMQVIEDFHLSVMHAIFSVIRQRLADAYQAQQVGLGAAAD